MSALANLSRAVVGITFLAVLLGAAPTAWACPSCQAALNSDGSQGDLARGIYYSILFMMSMPFAITGAFAGLMYRAVKREQRRLAETEQHEREEAQPGPLDGSVD
jgi:hypothetical protein